ncbi:flagellar assembly peptidoglycan hydrolase FlgJ [Ectothiorhodospira lacustris]|uniref:flagellar assembly peptidoglycan hydrolase FlgJ n=1 Tax=Ectothiorhodospira lacustris TaxID=2899127 RepID=UPI001EE9254F|nr:flagellar assembly peptidoglycan hydrolase FlgJ [Ectothiorhodospira lacustris]MCG5511038.1 flagellar assembly peptidoglycan hydrolase FlgJ [Ectothiorhodospira lacustris]MCG5522768.1 flagellar assembly peptidoglycan hydrolase FlgJ [Ectothiorhodospira lacustris]
MTSHIADSYHYTDMHGLAELRARTQSGSVEASDEVARQFEALFIQQMLKSMRAAMPTDGGLTGEHTRFFQGMFDQQIALDMARGNGIGLREQVMRELTGIAADAVSASPGELNMPTHRIPVVRSAIEAAAMTGASKAPETAAMKDSARAAQVTRATRADDGMVADGPWSPGSPQEFIRDLWPHAQRAAKALGVAPEVLVAQSALETGWGRHVIKHGDGRSSHNLFGIKADRRWEGARAHVQTLEYVNEVPELQRAAFRSYGGLAESFADYVNFLQTNPRYRQALEVAGDAEAYVRGLQSAGYATDPAYADKILNILERGTLSDTLAALKSGILPPTT